MGCGLWVLTGVASSQKLADVESRVELSKLLHKVARCLGALGFVEDDSYNGCNHFKVFSGHGSSRDAMAYQIEVFSFQRTSRVPVYPRGEIVR